MLSSYDHVHAQLLSRVWLFATPSTVAHQAPLSMGFSRQEYWSGLPFPTTIRIKLKKKKKRIADCVHDMVHDMKILQEC